jgi:ketosteroid isomerase-like protein
MYAPMWRNRAGATLCLAALAAGVAGCGGDADDEAGGDEQGARQAAEALVAAENERDFQAVCDLYSDELKRDLGLAGGQCAAFLKEHTTGADVPPDYELVDVRADGDTATAHLTAAGETGGRIPLTMVLRAEGGVWRISRFEPSKPAD